MKKPTKKRGVKEAEKGWWDGWMLQNDTGFSGADIGGVKHAAIFATKRDATNARTKSGWRSVGRKVVKVRVSLA